ncbi:MAG: leucyl aminopeptidase [Caulobacteraceae bacterium]
MEIEFAAAGPVEGEALLAVAVLAFDGPTLSPAAEALDAAASGALSRALAGGRFTGAAGQTLDLVACQGLHAARVVVVGAGAQGKLDGKGVQAAAAHAYNAVKTSGSTRLELRLTGLSAELAAEAALGARLAAYRFDRYRTTEKPDKKPSIASVRVTADNPDAAAGAYEPLSAVADGVIFARDLVSEPANVLHPEEFAARAMQLNDLGLDVEVLGEAEMEKLGMGSLLGVGLGSERQSQLVILRWNGAADPNAAPIAFVGKGVTFDTGGISIKPADGMEEMKTDMGGAAAVTGVMHALAGRKAKVNAVGILGLVENMPDGKAIRPGDVLTSMSGQTIEVINTDAEGRLVLADALWYCQDRFKPVAMIDLATLTGAIIIALGNDLAGIYSNDEGLAADLIAAGEASGDKLWRMPLPEAYEKQIESKIADVKNTGGRPGGSITAALFLQKFVNGARWAHLDIAPVAWRKSALPTVPEGASGFGVQLLNRLVADKYEG